MSPITEAQAVKILKAFFYVSVSFVLAAIPVWFASNATYIALAIPINVVLVTLKQLLTKDEQANVQALPEPLMNGVEQLTNQVTDLEGKVVTDPNAAR